MIIFQVLIDRRFLISNSYYQSWIELYSLYRGRPLHESSRRYSVRFSTSFSKSTIQSSNDVSSGSVRRNRSISSSASSPVASVSSTPGEGHSPRCKSPVLGAAQSSLPERLDHETVVGGSHVRPFGPGGDCRRYLGCGGKVRGALEDEPAPGEGSPSGPASS